MTVGRWLVEQLVLEMARRGQVIAGAKVLVLGLTLKRTAPIYATHVWWI